MTGEPEGGFLGGEAAERAVDPLGVAGRARRVVHDVADGPVGWIVGRLDGPRGLERGEPRDVADGQTPVGVEIGFGGSRLGCVGEPLVGYEGLGAGVLQDVGDLGRHKMMVDGDEVPTGLQGGQVELEHSRHRWEAEWRPRRRSPCRDGATRGPPGWSGPTARRRCTRCRLALPAPGGTGCRGRTPRIPDHPCAQSPSVPDDGRRRAGRSVSGCVLFFVPAHFVRTS